MVQVGSPLQDAQPNPHPEDTPKQIGAPLRDAATDPRAGDVVTWPNGQRVTLKSGDVRPLPGGGTITVP